jgi:hypothetical protein
MFAFELSNESINALQAIFLAIVAGIVAVRIRKIDLEQRRSRRQAREERERCNGLEKRVVELEAQLKRCLHARRRK